MQEGAHGRLRKARLASAGHRADWHGLAGLVRSMTGLAGKASHGLATLGLAARGAARSGLARKRWAGQRSDRLGVNRSTRGAK